MWGLLCLKRFLATDIIGDDQEFDLLIQKEFNSKLMDSRASRNSLQAVTIDFSKGKDEE